MFDSLTQRFSDTFRTLRSKGRLSPSDIDRVVREIRVALLEADVSLPVVRTFCEQVRSRAQTSEVSAALNPAQQMIKIVNEELVEILGSETRQLKLAKTPPTVIMLLGLQGAGKTTLAGKLGRYLTEQGHRPLLVAADLARPNAVDQLSVVADRAGVHVFAPEPGNGVGDPIKVASDGVAFGTTNGFDVVVVDTAGRLGADTALMDQARHIRETIHPDDTFLVVDAMVGQDAMVSSAAFAQQVGFDAVVLTKLDGDARGGAALSVRHTTGKPVIFVSTGENLDDFELFHPDRMASRILDLGDMLTLIEKAERVFDQKQTEKMSKNLAEGQFTLDDFATQLAAVRRMGSLGKLASMLPGMAEAKQQLENVDERELDRAQAIISSMTPAERADAGILNASRRARVARGSGVTVSAVNVLLERFTEAQKMMKQASADLAAGTAKRQRQVRKKTKGRSGNPAKRALQEAEQHKTATTPSVPQHLSDLLDK